MQATKLFFGFAVLFLCLVFNGGFVIGQETKGKASKQHGVANQGGSFGGKGVSKEEAEENVHHALEELKLLTNEVTKKTAVNKNVLIGSALAQTVLLLVVTALVGYSLKDKKGGENNDKPRNPETPEGDQ